MSTTITLYGTSSVLEEYFNPSIELKGDWEVALIDFNVYNSIPNVNETNNQLKIGGSIVKIPIGTYELEDLSDFIDAVAKVKHETHKVVIKGNTSTLKTEIKSTIELDFSCNNSIGSILGFGYSLISPNKLYVSKYPVKISTVDDIRIECDIASGSYVRNNPHHTIYGFIVDCPAGYRIVERPSNAIYYPVNTEELSYLCVRIVDQKGELVDFRGEHITVRINLRRV